MKISVALCTYNGEKFLREQIDSILNQTQSVHEIGGFNINQFLYYKVTDLGKRLSKINKFTFLIPDAKYIHFHGTSIAKSIVIKTELKISLLFIIQKHYGYFWYLIILNKLRIQYFFKSFSNRVIGNYLQSYLLEHR